MRLRILHAVLTWQLKSVSVYPKGYSAKSKECSAGGCQDFRLIVDFIAAHLFPSGERVIDEFIATGMSLGGKIIAVEPLEVALST